MKRLELQGQRFSRLLVLEYSKEKQAWLCQCDCGTQKYVKSSDLVKEKTKSCGCLSRELAHERREHLEGQKFNRLLVLEEVQERRNKQIYWKCLCDCGTICEVNSGRLKNGTTQSCGCLHKEMLIQRNIENSEKILHKTFGRLIVIQDLGLRKQPSRNKNERWSLCKCTCGNTIEVRNNQLINGQTQSCGCLVSQGENIIENILKTNNIIYEKQYSFPDLKNIRPLRFDFAIFNNEKQLQFLIEFDGRQHYLGPESGWKDSSSLQEIQRRDSMKNEYCKKNNIILKRIPYFKRDEISLQTLFDDTFLINKD